VTWLEENHCRGSILNGFNALVTAGPTYEAIDLVRFIGNHSSGKMGFAIAEAMYLSGATVHLITGPTALEPKYIGIQVTRVQSAAEMYDAAVSAFPDSSIAIMSAAVADFSPTEVSMHKIKKTSSLTISLTKTKDILQSLGALKKKDQLLVGFALETQNERENAINKLVAKNADLIVLNSLNDEDVGFGKSTNRVTIFDRAGNEFAFPAKSKTEVAQDIIDLIVKKINEKA
jgi:phosphopantothenoylcysteine decarboxylase/phosphopantothenate--cysteine ligase